PVPTDLNQFVRRQDCTCNGEGCANCTVLFTLSKEGPAMVYSGDLVPAADAKFRIVDPKIPIVKLLEGQRLMLEAGAILGNGSEHAKWQVVTAVGYMEYPVIKVHGALSQHQAERLAKVAPPGVVSIEGTSLKVLEPLKAVAWLRSVKREEGLDNVEISFEPGRWLLRVETDGALSPVVALRKASSMLMEKLKQIESDVGNLKAPSAPAAN